MKVRFYFFIYLIFWSCTSNVQSNYLKKHADYLVDSLNLQLGESSTYEVTNFQYIQDSMKTNGNLFVLNKVNKSLDLYNLNSGFLTIRLSLKIDEKFGRFNPAGFLVHNSDSVFIFPGMGLNGTLLINMDGEVIKNYSANIPDEEHNLPVLNHAPLPSSPPYLKNGNIYLTNLTLRNSASEGALSKSFKTDIVFDLNKEFVYFQPDQSYPDFYQGKAFPTVFTQTYRVIGKDSRWVYSWPAIDSLFVFAPDFNKGKIIEAKSIFSKGMRPIPMGTPQWAQLEYFIKETSYGRVEFDPFRNLYYRIAIIGRPFNKDEDMNMEAYFKNQFSIIVMNENFKKQEEVLFPAGVYNPFAFFVGKKGVYMPRINPFYISLSDDEITYDIFDFCNHP